MKWFIRIMKDIRPNVAFKFSFSMATFLLLIHIILLDYGISTTYASSNNNNLSNAQTETTGKGHLYDNCLLHDKKYISLTIMIPGEISRNTKSSTHYTIPVSTCIDFHNSSDDIDSFVVENNDRAESESTNLILDEGKSISIILDNPERKKSSMFEVFLGCPVPTPPTYRDKWILLEFDRDNNNPLKFEIPVVVDDMKVLINKYEFGCTLIIREFTSNNTMWEFRFANTLIV
jgi:hypothetical protein